MKSLISNPPVNESRHKPFPGIDFAGEHVLTIQSMADECCIATILKKYKRGQISAADLARGADKMLFGDFSNVKSMADMYQMVEDANQLFNSLPTAVKEKFGYDAHVFVQAASDERNRGIFEELGLIDKKLSSAATPVADKTATPITSTT